MFKAELVGSRALFVKLAAMEKNLSGDVKQAIDNGAEMIRGDAQILAPEETGALSISIGVEVIHDQPMGYAKKIGPTDDLKSSKAGKPYSIFQEFGTSKMAASPYLRPAYDANISAIKKEIRDAVKMK